MIAAAATKNVHKIEEIRAITKEFGIEIISRDDAGIDPDLEIEETGETFSENSLIKAETVMKISGMPAVADDSGLMVDLLGGAPGVRSARYSGEHGDDDANNAKLLEELRGVPEERRTAAFVSVITLAFPDGKVITAEGVCRGRIAESCRGDSGFGYDPLFIPEGHDKTFGELGEEIKNSISHRSRALSKLAELLAQGNYR